MRIPKTLQELAKANGLSLQVEIIRYHFRNVVTIGFYLIDGDRNIIAKFEPINRMNGDKWLCKNYSEPHSFIFYLKRISEAKELKLKAGHTGFKLA